MMTQNHKLMIELAQKHDESGGEDQTTLRANIPKAVLASVENGLVSPSMLKAELEKLKLVNCDITQFEKSVQFEFWTEQPAREELGETAPTKDIWARGRSQTWQDALLHAILGYLRECDKDQK